MLREKQAEVGTGRSSRHWRSTLAGVASHSRSARVALPRRATNRRSRQVQRGGARWGEVGRRGARRGEAGRGGARRGEAGQAGAAEAEPPSQGQPSPAEPRQAHPSPAEPSRAQPSPAEPSRAEPYRDPRRGVALSAPQCHVSALSVPRQCHVGAMSVPRQCHVSPSESALLLSSCRCCRQVLRVCLGRGCREGEVGLVLRQSVKRCRHILQRLRLGVPGTAPSRSAGPRLMAFVDTAASAAAAAATAAAARLDRVDPLLRRRGYSHIVHLTHGGFGVVCRAQAQDRASSPCRSLPALRATSVPRESVCSRSGCHVYSDTQPKRLISQGASGKVSEGR